MTRVALHGRLAAPWRGGADVTPTAVTLDVVTLAASTLPATPVAAVIRPRLRCPRRRPRPRRRHRPRRLPCRRPRPPRRPTTADDCGFGDGGDIEFCSSAAVTPAVTPAVITLATFQGLT